MGLLPENEYDDKYEILNAEPKEERAGWNHDNSKLYNKVSVNDIIDTFGERKCIISQENFYNIYKDGKILEEADPKTFQP